MKFFVTSYTRLCIVGISSYPCIFTLCRNSRLVTDSCRRSDIKEKKRKEAEEKKKKAPSTAVKAAAGKASEKLGKAGGANIKPARISAPGKQSAR